MNFAEFKELGISTIPVGKDKCPVVKWKEYQSRLPTDSEIEEWEKEGHAVGVVMGSISGNIYSVDIDQKYSIDEKRLDAQLYDAFDNTLQSFLKSCLWVKTPSGGRHIVFRTEDTPTGNEKFASRWATSMELKEDPKAKVRVLFESRGEKGMVVHYPELKGSWDNLPTATEDQFEIIKAVCKSFNQVIKKEKVSTPREYDRVGSLSPLDDWQQQVDVSVVLDLLTKQGWVLVYTSGDKYYLRRPGKTSGVSAVLDDFFFCWSSSTEFPSDTGVSYAGVYTHLEHESDFSAAARTLSKEGYGEQLEVKEQREIISAMLSDDNTSLATEEEDLILSRISTSKQEMEAFLEYVKTARDFKLSPKFKELNKLMQDIQPGNYVGWASASGVGKTSTTRQVFNDYLNVTDQVGLFASMELKSRELALRNAQETRDPDEGHFVDRKVTTEKLMTDQDFRKSIVSDWSRFYSIDWAYDLQVIFETAAVLKRKLEAQGKRFGCVVVDFVQMAKNGHNIEKQPELATLIKMWAKKLDVVVVGILQINSSKNKFEEPTENDISGHKALFQTSDFGFLMWKNETNTRRIIIASKKERHTLEGRCDLVQVGMRIHSEDHQPIDEAIIASMAGNRGFGG